MIGVGGQVFWNCESSYVEEQLVSLIIFSRISSYEKFLVCDFDFCDDGVRKAGKTLDND